MFQAPVCSPELNKCVKDIRIEDSHCLPSCEGVLVTSYTKSENTVRPEDALGKAMEEYDVYKGKVEYPAGLKGTIYCEIE